MVILHNFFNPTHYEYFLNKYKDIPVTMFMDHIPNLEQLSLNRTKIYLLHEPNELFKVHNWVEQNYFLFDTVLTYNKHLLNKLPNAVEFSFGLVHTDDKNYYNKFITPEKEFKVSFLCGTTNWAEGHKFRQRIYKLKKEVKIPNEWKYVLEDFDVSKQVRPGYTHYSKDLSHIPNGEVPEYFGKRILFTDFMFHVAVENVKIDNWYTEKIAQSFATKTVPIYWGCPNIKELGYDERGIIRFNSEEELIRIVNNLTLKDYYSRLPYIEYNYQVAMKDTFRNKLSSFLDQIKLTNNL
jgi:hypothetical protein